MKRVLGESRSRFRGAPMRRWLPWVFSFVLALILWGTAIQNRTFAVTLVLPVAPPETPSGYMIMSDLSAESVRVDFRGNGVQVILDQLFRKPSALDLGGFDPGGSGEFPRTVAYQLSSGNVAFAGHRSIALQAQSFTPSSVSLLVDRKVIRSVPVRVPSGGDVPGRFMWPSFSRSTVEVTGAAAVVVGMDSIETEAVFPGEEQARVEVLLPQGVSGSNPRTVSAAYTAPVPVVFDVSE